MGPRESAESVAVVIVNYNGLEDTLACLRALERLDPDPPHRAFVVDNGSARDEAATLRATFPEAAVLRSDRNLGFAGACNLAMREALEQGYEYVFLLNNDAWPDQPDLLRRLVDATRRDPRYGIVGAKIVYAHEPSRVWYVDGRVHPRWGATRHPGKGRPADRFSGLKEVDDVVGCALLVRSEVLRDVGFLDEDYFLYREETDWNLRARREGYQPVVDRDAVVVHQCGASITVGDANYYYFTRSDLRFAKRWAGPWFWPVALPCKLAYAATLVGYNAVRGRWRRAAAVAEGVVDFARGRTGARGPAAPPREPPGTHHPTVDS